VLEQLVWETVGQPVEDHPTLLAKLHQAGRAEQPQPLRDRVVAHLQGEGEISDAELVRDGQREEDAAADRVLDETKKRSQPTRLIEIDHVLANARDPPGINRVIMVQRRHHQLLRYPYDSTGLRI
jgi:hypothetical protein